MALRLEEMCPKCGSHLMIREGGYGDFLACPRFPACKFTKPLPDSDLAIYKKPSPYCKKCNHTGLVPSKVLGKFSGKPISNCFEDCECKLSIHHDLTRLKPEDFDFPVSYEYHRMLAQRHGWDDPGIDKLPAIEERPLKPSQGTSSQVYKPFIKKKKKYTIEG